MNLDIDLNEAFTERVDLDETRIDSTIEATKLGNQANISLGDRFVWVRTEYATWNSTQSSNARSKSIDWMRLAGRNRGGADLVHTHASIPAMSLSIVALQDLSITWLKVFSTGRLDVYERVVAAGSSLGSIDGRRAGVAVLARIESRHIRWWMV